MWFFGNDKQHIMIVTAKGNMERDKLDAGTLCAVSFDTSEAWELDFNQQATNEKNGKPTQFVSTLNKQPLIIYKKRPRLKSQSTESIAAQEFDERLGQVQKSNQRKSQLLWLGIFLLAITVITGIIVLLNIRGGSKSADITGIVLAMNMAMIDKEKVKAFFDSIKKKTTPVFNRVRKTIFARLEQVDIQGSIQVIRESWAGWRKERAEQKKAMAPKRKNGQIESIDELKDFARVNGHERCIIVHEPSGTWGYRMVKKELIPAKSIPIDDAGTTHLLGYDGKDLWAIDYMPVDNTDKTPKDCFEAQSWDELEIILNMETPLLEKIKLGIFVALGFGALVVFFLISTIAMGGSVG